MKKEAGNIVNSMFPAPFPYITGYLWLACHFYFSLHNIIDWISSVFKFHFLSNYFSI